MSFLRLTKTLVFFVVLFLYSLSLCISEQIHQKDDAVLRSKDLESLSLDHSKEIIFGQSGFFIGHFKVYGDTIRHGIQAYFNRMNEHGGIHNKKLRLVSIEDEGNAEIAYNNIDTLMKKHGVDYILGVMGTRSIFKMLPLIDQKKIAMLFPWGGDPKLRNPKYSHLVSGLGFVEPQIDELVRHIIEDLKFTKIGIFHSDSDFDTENAHYMQKVLENYGIKPAIVSDYNRFSMNISYTTKKLIEADPRVILCLASSMPVVKLINNFLQAGNFGTQFFGIDSTLSVGEILNPKGITFYYTSSMPDPYNSKLEIVKQYRSDMKKYFPNDQLNILSLAYYIHAAIICKALAKCSEPLSKDKAINAIEALRKTDVGGFQVDFNPTTRYAYPQNVTLIKG